MFDTLPFSSHKQEGLAPLIHALEHKGCTSQAKRCVVSIGMAYDQPFHHVRTSVNLLGLRNTVRDLNMGSFNYNKIRPIPNMPLLIPSPYPSSTDGDIYQMLCRDSRGGRGHSASFSSGTVGFSASGEELPDDGWMEWWACL